jgi:hypothetical protein
LDLWIDELQVFAGDARVPADLHPEYGVPALLIEVGDALYKSRDLFRNRTSLRRPSLEYLKEKMPDGIRGFDGKWEKRSLDQALRKLGMALRKEMPPKHTIAFHTSPKKFRKRTIK